MNELQSRRPVKLRDVARHAGVSAASVSRVLNGSTLVHEKTRERVLAAIAELDFSVDQRARALRRQQSDTIALIIADLGNASSNEFIQAIERFAGANGYDTFLCNSDEDPQRERLHLDAMRSQRITGVIVFPVTYSGAYLKPLVAAGVPVICIDRVVTDIALDTVIIDNRAGGALAATALLDAGHTRIGVVGEERSSPGRDRFNGCAARIADSGHPFDPELFRRGGYTFEGGYRETKALFALEHPPTALFVENHPMTLGALLALRDLGLRVPHDVSIVGFDDPIWAQLLNPALTTVRQPNDRIGAAAAELLIDRISARYTGVARHVVFQPELQDRASIGPPRTHT